MHRLGDSLYIVDGAEDVRRMCARHKLRLRTHEAAQDIAIELRVRLVG